jgi:hypothetical protein
VDVTLLKPPSEDYRVQSLSEIHLQKLMKDIVSNPAEVGNTYHVAIFENCEDTKQQLERINVRYTVFT